MNKLVIHTGLYNPKHPALEVIGVTSLSPAQRIATGRALRPSSENTIRNVFVDDPLVLRGVQESVGKGDLTTKEVLIMFDPGKKLEKHLIHILAQGNLDRHPSDFPLT